jgi:hypothetical protein
MLAATTTTVSLAISWAALQANLPAMLHNFQRFHLPVGIAAEHRTS